MKKSLALLALLALVSSMVITGCKPADETPKAPEAPPTNAPAK